MILPAALLLVAALLTAWVVPLLHRLWAALYARPATGSPTSALCDAERHIARMSDDELDRRIEEQAYRYSRRPLPGAAEGGSTYVHREDDWFDEHRPAHPDRPDEDY